MSVGSTVPLTDFDRVRDLLGLTDPAEETRLSIERYIAIVSRVVESEMDRVVLKSARTEVFDVEDFDQHLFIVQAPPIDVSVTPVVKRRDVYDTTAWASIDAVDDVYVKVHDDDTGRIVILLDLYTGPQTLQVAYTGGMGVDFDAVEAYAPALVEAITLEVAHHFQRRGAIGSSDVNTGDIERRYGKLSFLDTTKSMVARFTRWGGL